MLSKTSLDEIFMHHFEKMLSASGGFAARLPPGSCLWTLLGDFHPSDPLIAHPWKKSCRRP